MTRRDFQLIAAALKKVAPTFIHPLARGQHDLTAYTLADALAGTNPKFDRARFLSASGVHTNKGDHHA